MSSLSFVRSGGSRLRGRIEKLRGNLPRTSAVVDWAPPASAGAGAERSPRSDPLRWLSLSAARSAPRLAPTACAPGAAAAAAAAASTASALAAILSAVERLSPSGSDRDVAAPLETRGEGSSVTVQTSGGNGLAGRSGGVMDRAEDDRGPGFGGAGAAGWCALRERATPRGGRASEGGGSGTLSLPSPREDRGRGGRTGGGCGRWSDFASG